MNLADHILFLKKKSIRFYLLAFGLLSLLLLVRDGAVNLSLHHLFLVERDCLRSVLDLLEVDKPKASTATSGSGDDLRALGVVLLEELHEVLLSRGEGQVAGEDDVLVLGSVGVPWGSLALSGLLLAGGAGLLPGTSSGGAPASGESPRRSCELDEELDLVELGALDLVKRTRCALWGREPHKGEPLVVGGLWGDNDNLGELGAIEELRQIFLDDGLRGVAHEQARAVLPPVLLAGLLVERDFDSGRAPAEVGAGALDCLAGVILICKEGECKPERRAVLALGDLGLLVPGDARLLEAFLELLFRHREGEVAEKYTCCHQPLILCVRCASAWVAS